MSFILIPMIPLYFLYQKGTSNNFCPRNYFNSYDTPILYNYENKYRFTAKITYMSELLKLLLFFKI